MALNEQAIETPQDPPEAQAPAKDSVEVDLSPPDEGEDDAPPEVPRQTRRERRANRFSEAQRRAEEAERRAEEAERRANQALQMAQYAATRTAAAPTPARDPAEDELDSIYRDHDSLAREWALEQQQGPVSQSRREEFMRRGRALDERKAAALYRREVARSQPTPEQAHQAEQVRLLQARYPDVMADERLRNWAVSRYNQLVMEGQSHGWETTDLAMNEARAKFRRGGQPAPVDPAMRSRMAGPPRSAQGDGGAPRSVTMDAKTRAMADAALSHIKDEKQRYRVFAERMLARQSKQRGG